MAVPWLFLYGYLLLLSVVGAESDCMTTVGLEDGRIKDNQINASSHWNEHKASNARLHNKYKFDNNGKFVWGGWCTDKRDTHQYLNIDLGHVRAVSGVATQGYMAGFVKNYKMNYSLDGQDWKMFVQNGTSKIFSGNWDNETVIRNWFSRVLARYIRLNPISWSPNGFICMRIEIYECLPKAV